MMFITFRSFTQALPVKVLGICRPIWAVYLLLVVLFSASLSDAHVSIEEGVYEDREAGLTVKVTRNKIPGITFIRVGPPYYFGLYINTWTLDGYRSRHSLFEVVNLERGARPAPLNRGSENLYNKIITPIDEDRTQVTYEDGTPNGYAYKKFSLVINTADGKIESFSHEDSQAWKSISWWPRIGNVVLFKLRLHTGPFNRRRSAVSCNNLLLGALQNNN